MDKVKATLDELEQRTRAIHSANLDLERITKRLAAFLPHQVRELTRTPSDDFRDLIKAERKYITILFGDLEGFTDFAEVVDPEVVTDVLNEYFDMVQRLIDKHDGLLDKFIGDGFMAFWGAPVTKGRQEDAIDAARFALEVRKEFQLIATRWKTSGLDKQIRLRLGLHSGYCSVGNFGSHRRLQFTAMGNPVNVASRLESASKAGHITTSLATQAMLSSQFDLNEKGKIEVKGIKHPLTGFDLVEERQFSSKNNLDQVTAFLSSLEGSTFVDRETLEALRDIATIKRRREGSSETAVAA